MEHGSRPTWNGRNFGTLDSYESKVWISCRVCSSQSVASGGTSRIRSMARIDAGHVAGLAGDQRGERLCSLRIYRAPTSSSRRFFISFRASLALFLLYAASPEHRLTGEHDFDDLMKLGFERQPESGLPPVLYHYAQTRRP